MNNFNLGQIFFISILIAAIVLILWNLRLNNPPITIIPGPTILVNGECENDGQCIDGRSCFDSRCTQILVREMPQEIESTPPMTPTPLTIP